MKKKNQKSASAPPVEVAAKWMPPIGQTAWIASAVLFLLCVAVYYPIHENDFVDYDDGAYLHHNPPVMAGLTFDSVVWAWTSVKKYYWQPLTWMSHMLDVSLFGMNPGAHHVMNLVFHSINAVLLLLALYRLTGALWPSAGAAALHALHPLRVESVAWAAERKDVLSGLFFSLTLLAYAGYVKTGTKRSYWLLLAAAAAAFCSKPTVVVLPVVLLLLDWWPLGRGKDLNAWKALLVEKAPIFAMTAAVSILTVVGQREKAMFSVEQLPLDLRLWNAVRAFASYLGKFVYPANLGVFYPHEDIDGLERAGMLLLLIGISVAAWMLRKRAGYLIVGWVWFLAGVLPTSGLAQSGEQAYADRFTYIPGIGLAVAVCFGVADLLERRPLPRMAVASGAGAILVIFGMASWQQTHYWKNTEAMAQHAIEVTNKNPNMRHLLGALYLREQRNEEAEVQFRELLKIYPEYGGAHKNLGHTQMRRKNFPEALNEYTIAVQQNAADLESRKLRALALMQLGRREEAVRELQTVLSVNPGDPQATQWLGSAGGTGTMPAGAASR